MTNWARHEVICAECGAMLMRRLFRPKDRKRIERFFCDTKCKGAWQQKQKPWDEAWLRQKYISEHLSANDIAAIVGRDPKRVWEWLRDYGIPTRERGHDERQRFQKGHTLGVGRKHSEQSKARLSASRKGTDKFPRQDDGRPYWAGKVGELHPTWRGGATPERQSFYATQQWKDAARATYARAKGCCERCGAKKQLHVHHVIPFVFEKYRADVRYLRVLCATCHRWVHGRNNGDREFLPAFGSLPLHREEKSTIITIGPKPRKKAAIPQWLLSNQ